MADEIPVLICAGERILVPVAAVSRDSAVEDVPWKMFHDLGEDQAAELHCVLLIKGAVQGG